MADSDPGAAGASPATDPNAPEFSLQSVYLKDSSYEAPKGPRIEGQWNPQISLDLNTAAETLAPDLREIVLTISVTAKVGETTAFLVEVKQAGVFGVRNLGEEDYRRAVASTSASLGHTRSRRNHALRAAGLKARHSRLAARVIPPSNSSPLAPGFV